MHKYAPYTLYTQKDNLDSSDINLLSVSLNDQKKMILEKVR
jgi:hypothetical protein